jgi:hypothetical protein
MEEIADRARQGFLGACIAIAATAAFLIVVFAFALGGPRAVFG